MESVRRIDVNCDLGETDDPTMLDLDAELMRHVSSVNIACGYHSGNPEVMRRTVEHAIRHEVAIGAHPSFPDRENFGRRELSLQADEIQSITYEQVSTLKRICDSDGATLTHVKPHGALYNMAAKDRRIAKAILDAVLDIDPELLIVGLSQSSLIAEAKLADVGFLEEGFPDRSYESDGSLTPRSFAEALITDPALVSRRALAMASGDPITTRTGERIRIPVTTLCVHGDGITALECAIAVRETLTSNGFLVEFPS